MLLLFAAMKCEARPFIDRLGLKRDPSFINLEVYSGDGIKICITGMGKVDAATAVSSVLSSSVSTDDVILFNIGVCAGAESGCLYRINKIHDEDSGKDQYPDMIYRTDHPEICLHTSDGYKTDDLFSDDMGDFVYDMEGSAVFRAASFYISPDRIILFKIVSDHGDPDSVTAELCAEMIGRYSDELIKEMNQIASAALKADPYEKADEICERYSEMLHCTGYMTNALSRLIRYALSRDIDIESMLDPYLPVASKKEGKEVISDVERKLIL